MPHPRHRLRVFAVAAAALGNHACQAPAAPELDPASVAGTYVLRSVTGRGPTAGTFTLGRDRRAERRVRYGAATEYVAVGSYELRPRVIQFQLRENDGRSDHVWPVRAERTGTRFSLRYPDAGDGADIVETYVRR